MTSLKYHLEKEEKNQCLFVIQVAEPEENKARKMVHDINATLYNDIQAGLVQVTWINPDFYPSISIISKTKESMRRVYWRSKQNLDMIYLMDFCIRVAQPDATFYVQLEDDIVTRVS